MKRIYFVGAPTEAKGILEFDTLAGFFPKTSFNWFCYKATAEITSTYRKINFIVGLNDLEIRDKIKSMDLLISCSKFEGFCLPIAEALLLNKPVISFDLDEIKSVFKNNIEYVESHNLEQFRKKIGEYISNQTYDIDIKKAHEFIVEQFFPEKIKQRFLDVILK